MKEWFTLKKAVTFLLSTIGVFGTVLGIYSYYFDKKEINVVYDIIGNINVLDINADISKIDILYNQTSLKKIRRT